MGVRKGYWVLNIVAYAYGSSRRRIDDECNGSGIWLVRLANAILHHIRH